MIPSVHLSRSRRGKPLTITEPRMTRLLLPLAEAVRLVTFAMEHGRQGDLFVRKATAATVQDLAEALLEAVRGGQPDRDRRRSRGREAARGARHRAEEMARRRSSTTTTACPAKGGRDYDRYFTKGELSPVSRRTVTRPRTRTDAWSRTRSRTAAGAARGARRARQLAWRAVHQAPGRRMSRIADRRHRAERLRRPLGDRRLGRDGVRCRRSSRCDREDWEQHPRRVG